MRPGWCLGIGRRSRCFPFLGSFAATVGARVLVFRPYAAESGDEPPSTDLVDRVGHLGQERRVAVVRIGDERPDQDPGRRNGHGRRDRPALPGANGRPRRRTARAAHRRPRRRRTPRLRPAAPSSEALATSGSGRRSHRRTSGAPGRSGRGGWTARPSLLPLTLIAGQPARWVLDRQGEGPQTAMPWSPRATSTASISSVSLGRLPSGITR